MLTGGFLFVLYFGLFREVIYMIELSFKSKQRLFNRKMEREGYAARLYRYEDKSECMLTHVDTVNSTHGVITLRTKRYNMMGEFNSPIYNIRASRIIRDVERQLRMFTDPSERQKKIDAARSQEMREEIKDKWRAMLNRNNFFGQIG
jgi:hypothetical protein